MHARLGQRAVNVVSGVAGALVCKGVDTLPGEGSCKEWWAMGRRWRRARWAPRGCFTAGLATCSCGSAMEPLSGAANTTSP